MSKIAKRLFIFFVGLPLVLLMVSVSYMNHLIIHFAIAIFSVLAGYEFYSMLEGKNMPLFRRGLILIFTGLLPYMAFFSILTGNNLELVFWTYIAELLILFAYESLFKKNFIRSMEKIALSAFIILYSGFFVTFISRMTTLPNPTFMLVFFFILVFMCDSGGWFFGMLFGKSTRGILAASPNKSLVGFIGGLASSLACAFVLKALFPDVFYLNNVNLVIISLLTSVSAIIGDLIESVIKRSLDCKDSGSLIPGRGGVLDSIDSLLVAAPVFYVAVQFLFK